MLASITVILAVYFFHSIAMANWQDCSSISFAANVICVVIGGIAVLGLGLILYFYHLPKHRYRSLDNAMKDTEDIWTVELSRLDNPELRRQIDERLFLYAFSYCAGRP